MTIETPITGHPCGHCRTILQPGDTAAVCATCGAVHHAACWAFNGHCSSAECDGTPTQQVAPPAGAFGAPADPLAPAPRYVPPTPAPPTITMPGVGVTLGNVPPDTGVGTALNYGWAALQRNLGTAIAGTLVMFLIALAASLFMLIPLVGFLAIILLAPPFMGGYVRFGTNLVNDRNPQIADLFAEYANFGRWTGLYWLTVGISLVCVLPMFAISGAAMFPIMKAAIAGGAASASPPIAMLAMMPLIILGELVALVVMALVFTRLFFMYNLVNEGYGALDALRKSAEMTAPRYGNTLLVMVVAYIVYMVGAFVCGIGILVTLPLAFCMQGCYYNAVKAQCGMP